MVVSKHLTPVFLIHKAARRARDNVPVTNMEDSSYCFNIKKCGPSPGAVSPSPGGLLSMQDVAQPRSPELSSASQQGYTWFWGTTVLERRLVLYTVLTTPKQQGALWCCWPVALITSIPNCAFRWADPTWQIGCPLTMDSLVHIYLTRSVWEPTVVSVMNSLLATR